MSDSTDVGEIIDRLKVRATHVRSNVQYDNNDAELDLEVIGALTNLSLQIHVLKAAARPNKYTMHRVEWDRKDAGDDGQAWAETHDDACAILRDVKRRFGVVGVAIKETRVPLGKQGICDFLNKWAVK